MKKSKALFVAKAGIIAALYVVFTYVSGLLGLSSGAIQCRISEAFTILPLFMPEAIPALFIGCFLSNFLVGGVIMDVVCGSLVTLVAAVITFLIGKIKFRSNIVKYICGSIPPVLLNALIVPIVLQVAYGVTDAYWFLFLTVGAGELICCTILGVPFAVLYEKRISKFIK